MFFLTKNRFGENNNYRPPYAKLPCFGKDEPDEVLIRGCVRGRRKATIKRAGAEAIQIKGPQRDDKGDNKDSESR